MSGAVRTVPSQKLPLLVSGSGRLLCKIFFAEIMDLLRNQFLKRKRNGTHVPEGGGMRMIVLG